MKTENIFKAYGRQGVSMDLARLATPADLVPLKKVEKAFALAIRADEEADWQETGTVPEMKVRIGNLKRGSTYLDCYMSALEKATQPRGVVITYPNGDGYGARWHGNVWKSEQRISFEYALSDARKKIRAAYQETRPSYEQIVEVGERWEAALADLVAALTERASAQIAA